MAYTKFMFSLKVSGLLFAVWGKYSILFLEQCLTHLKQAYDQSPVRQQIQVFALDRTLSDQITSPMMGNHLSTVGKFAKLHLTVELLVCPRQWFPDLLRISPCHALDGLLASLRANTYSPLYHTKNILIMWSYWWLILLLCSLGILPDAAWCIL